MSHKKYTRAQKEAYVARWNTLRASGLSDRRAASEAGVSLNTLKNWEKNPAGTPAKRGGRPRNIELNEEESVMLKRLILKHESVPYAAERLMDAECCRVETRQKLGDAFNKREAQGGRVFLGRGITAIGKLPECVEACFRGSKHARGFEPKARRGGFITLADGTEIDLIAGAIYESDDMSVNEPFRFRDALMGHDTVGRQSLFTLDTGSNASLQLDLVGRARDAYRVEDIADHFLAVVEAHGLPLLWRLEMGSWASNFVLGIEVDGMKDRWGGLSDLFFLAHKFNSTGKANVEKFFDLLQRHMAHLSTSIGRNRGEFEAPTKLMRQANNGQAAALERFWPIAEASREIHAILDKHNVTRREFKKLGGVRSTPAELFTKRLVRPFRNADRWYFMPVKKAATIRKQVIECKVPHYPRSFRFITTGNEEFPILPEGYKVLIAFHPGHPENGCYVFNAERVNAARNIHSLGMAESMGCVPLFRDVAEENLAGTGDYEQVSHGAAAIRKEMRTIIPAGTGPGTLKSIARDGLGNALEMQSGGTPSEDTVKGKPRKVRGEVPSPAPTITTAGSRETVPPEVSSLAVRDRHLDTSAKRQAEIKRLKESLANM